MKVIEINNPCCQASGRVKFILTTTRGLSHSFCFIVNIKHAPLTRPILRRTKPSLGEQPFQVEGLKLPNTAIISALHLYLGGRGRCPAKLLQEAQGEAAAAVCWCGDSSPWTHGSARCALPSTATSLAGQQR